MQPIVVYGAGGHAKVVAQSLRRTGAWDVIGFIDDVRPERAGEGFAKSRVLGGRSVLAELHARGVRAVMLAFGHSASRLSLRAQIAAEGWRFPVIVDPHAVVADDAVLGEGSYVAAGALVQPGARIGAQTIVNTGAIVEHDTDVGEGVHLCPASCIAGHVQVGRGSWIGAGAVVRDRVRIGANCFIGTGSLVLADVPDGWMAYGHPARPIREVHA